MWMNLLMPILICRSYKPKLWTYVQSFVICKVQIKLDPDHGSGWPAERVWHQGTECQEVKTKRVSPLGGERSHEHHLTPSSALMAPLYTFPETVTYGTAGRGRQQGHLTTWVVQDPRGFWAEDRGELRGGGEGLGLQFGELLLHRAWQWGWGWDIRRQVTTQGAELKAISSLHTRVSTSLNSVLWGPHLPHPSSSHLNENVTISRSMQYVTSVLPRGNPAVALSTVRPVLRESLPLLSHSQHLFIFP